jgi:hypothetical protein
MVSKLTFLMLLLAAPMDTERREECDAICRVVIEESLRWLRTEYGPGARPMMIDTARSGLSLQPGRMGVREFDSTVTRALAQQLSLRLGDYQSARLGEAVLVATVYSPAISDGTASISIRVQPFEEGRITGHGQIWEITLSEQAPMRWLPTRACTMIPDGGRDNPGCRDIGRD